MVELRALHHSPTSELWNLPFFLGLRKLSASPHFGQSRPALSPPFSAQPPSLSAASARPREHSGARCGSTSPLPHYPRFSPRSAFHIRPFGHPQLAIIWDCPHSNPKRDFPSSKGSSVQLNPSLLIIRHVAPSFLPPLAIPALPGPPSGPAVTTHAAHQACPLTPAALNLQPCLIYAYCNLASPAEKKHPAPIVLSDSAVPPLFWPSISNG